MSCMHKQISCLWIALLLLFWFWNVCVCVVLFGPSISIVIIITITTQRSPVPSVPRPRSHPPTHTNTSPHYPPCVVGSSVQHRPFNEFSFCFPQARRSTLVPSSTKQHNTTGRPAKQTLRWGDCFIPNSSVFSKLTSAEVSHAS